MQYSYKTMGSGTRKKGTNKKSESETYSLSLH